MSDVLQKQVSPAIASGITVTTTTETLVAYSGRAAVPLPTIRSHVRGWLNIAIGTGTTALTMRIRRGNGVTGAVVQSTLLSVAASANEDMTIEFNEQLSNAEFADYSLTIQQTGATGNATVNQGIIEVEMING
jgi:hypothetical protein